MARAALIWAGVAAAICIPIAAAMASPLLAWRGPVYILAGLAGIVALGALLFASPTPFSLWGVIAMWAIFAVALLAALRRRLGLRLRNWRISHMLLAMVIVVGSVVHSMLIEGTMETMSKAALCALVIAATIGVTADLRRWRKRGPLSPAAELRPAPTSAASSER